MSKRNKHTLHQKRYSTLLDIRDVQIKTQTEPTPVTHTRTHTAHKDRREQGVQLPPWSTGAATTTQQRLGAYKQQPSVLEAED